VAKDVRAAIELLRILRRERIDILHTHNPKPGFYGRILGGWAKVPIVVNTVHGLYATPEDSWPKRLLVYLLEAVASWFSDAELYQSSEDFDLIKRLPGFARRKAQFLGNGVDLSRFGPVGPPGHDRAAIRAMLGLGEGEIAVGTVGRLVAEKGYLELFAATRQLDSSYVVFVIGPNDPDKPDALTEASMAAARADGVHFLGMRTDVEDLYRALDIFVLPSHREGFPRSAMEAAATGLPVVASDIRGCREVVVDGVNGLLIPVGDATALAGAVIRLGSDPQLRMRMGEEGIARAKAYFDENVIVETVLNAYRGLARKKGLVDLVDALGGLQKSDEIRLAGASET
jgi:glycosyltransferase involved in cell wall biosynthesis